MKLYRVMQGTQGKVINQAGVSQPWTVSKNLSFWDTQIDPVRLRNQGETAHNNSQFVQLAKDGFAVFCDLTNPKYYLAVPYDQVRIVA